MVIVLIILFITLTFGNVWQYRQRLLDKIDYKTLDQRYEREKSLNKKSTENVLGFLEASATLGDQTAVKLLAAHKALPEEGWVDLKKLEPQPELPPPPPPPPAWEHNIAVPTPPEKHWDIFLGDLRRETVETSRLEVLRHWIIDMGNRLTLTEKSAVLDMFEDQSCRLDVRSIFAEAETKDKAEKEKKRARITGRGSSS